MPSARLFSGQPLRRRVAVFVFSCAALLGLPGIAQEAQPEPTREPTAAVGFRHGVNLSNWFANAERQPLVQTDFEKIEKAGFDHVRIPVNPEFFGFSVFDAATGRILFDFSKLDQAIGFAESVGLSVILDIQPGENLASQIEQDRQADIGFVALWQHIAEHYQDRTPEKLAFEIVNEPRFNTDLQNYTTLVADLIAAIRRTGAKNPIVIDAPLAAALDALADLKPVRDQNVFYAFHFYEPLLFTHQGMKMASPIRSLRYFHNLPYPSKLADLNFNYAPVAADPITAKRDLLDYMAANWDEGHIRARIKVAADWAQANHTRLICTEFGVIRPYVSAASRYQWIADTRKALETAGIGWSLLDYTDLFGIVTLTGATAVDRSDGSIRLVDPQSGSRDIDNQAISALFSN
jgi:endoglucanase